MCATLPNCNCTRDLHIENAPVTFARLRHPDHIPKIGAPPFKKDLLAIVSSTHKEALDSFYRTIDKATSNDKIKIILQSSQPVHALAALAVCLICSTVLPSQTTSPKPYSTMTAFLYITSFSLHLGSQFWMTFVSGLTLYFSLTRHAFGDVQRVLFPRYFTINSVLSALNLITYSKLHSHVEWESRHWIQMICISSCFLAETLARLYIAPTLVKIMDSKRQIEESEPGVGKEVGTFEPGRLKNCPHYMIIHSNFRKQHAIITVANIYAMVCTIVQLSYISQSFRISI